MGPDKIENLSVPVSRLFDWKFYKNISGRIYIIKTKIIIINNNNKIIIIIIIIKIKEKNIQKKNIEKIYRKKYTEKKKI